MKHKTLIFAKITAAMYQQGIISEKKKNNLVAAWQAAVKETNRRMLLNLVSELLAIQDMLKTSLQKVKTAHLSYEGKMGRLLFAGISILTVMPEHL